MEEALLTSRLGAKLAGTERDEDICPVDLERIFRPVSLTLLLIESSSDGCEDIADEEFEDGMFGVDFLRWVNSEARRAPKLFLDLLDGALVDRVKVEVWCGVVGEFVVAPFLPFFRSSFELAFIALRESVAILSRSMSVEWQVDS